MSAHRGKADLPPQGRDFTRKSEQKRTAHPNWVGVARALICGLTVERTDLTTRVRYEEW